MLYTPLSVTYSEESIALAISDRLMPHCPPDFDNLSQGTAHRIESTNAPNPLPALRLCTALPCFRTGSTPWPFPPAGWTSAPRGDRCARRKMRKLKPPPDTEGQLPRNMHVWLLAWGAFYEVGQGTWHLYVTPGTQDCVGATVFIAWSNEHLQVITSQVQVILGRNRDMYAYLDLSMGYFPRGGMSKVHGTAT